MKNRPKIIAMYGLSGSGKDTAAKIIQNTTMYTSEQFRLGFKELISGELDDTLERYSSWEIKKFSTLPKEYVAKLLNVIPINMEDRIWRNQAHNNFNMTPLEMCIKMAQKLKEVYGNDVWAKSLMNSYVHEDVDFGGWIITDLRFPEEYELLKKYNTLFLKVVRKELDKKYDTDGLLEDYDFHDVINNDHDDRMVIINDCWKVIKKYGLHYNPIYSPEDMRIL